jgi:uncharacterized membrane protein
MRPLRRILLATAILLPVMALLAARASGQATPGRLHLSGIQRMRGASPAAATPATNPPNMVYNGGAVLPNTTTYAIWWGKRSDFPPDAVEAMDTFLENLDGSDYLHIADQYMLGGTAHTRFGGNLFDSSAPPIDPVALLVQGIDPITPVILNALQNNGLKLDPTAAYLLFTSNFPNEPPPYNTYCAWHGYGTGPDNITPTFQVAYLPNPTSAQSICPANFDPLFNPNNYSDATRTMVNFTAHEFMETITDPNIGGWYASDGNEIGDPCDFVFQTWVPLEESGWKIQEIWSNQASGCVQGAGRDGRVLGASSNSGAIKAFDIAAATYGTFARSVNANGAIAGFFVDAFNQPHGFVRDPHGLLSTFDDPNAASGFSGGTTAYGINAEGAIAGFYVDANGVLHGFVRDKRGAFSTIDAPGAGDGLFNGTVIRSINNDGAVTGDYADASNVNHGFVRDPHGNFAQFDAPGVGNGVYGGTFVKSINESTAVAGYFLDANFVNHGFVRDKYGNITPFDAPGAGNIAGAGTFAWSINDDGAVAGNYTDASFKNHGYIRDKHGLITTFDAPGGVYGTFAYGINEDGTVAGYYSDASGFPHGFVRDKHGNFTKVDTPGKSYGTVLRSINDAGAVAGYHTAPTP